MEADIRFHEEEDGTIFTIKYGRLPVEATAHQSCPPPKKRKRKTIHIAKIHIVNKQTVNSKIQNELRKT